MLGEVCGVVGGRVGEEVVVDESGDTVFALHCANLSFALRMCLLCVQEYAFRVLPDENIGGSRGRCHVSRQLFTVYPFCHAFQT